MAHDPADDMSITVGEYVLGLLNASENAVIERQLRTDDALRAEYHGWIMRLSGYNAGFAETPARTTYQTISTRLFGAPVRPSLSRGLKITAVLAVLVVVAIKITLISEIIAYFTR